MIRFWQNQKQFNTGTIFFADPPNSFGVMKSVGIYSVVLSSNDKPIYTSANGVAALTYYDDRIGITDVRINKAILGKGFNI